MKKKDNKSISIKIKPGKLKVKGIQYDDSLLLEKIATSLKNTGNEDSSIWRKVINPVSIESILNNDIVKFYSNLYSRDSLVSEKENRFLWYKGIIRKKTT